MPAIRDRVRSILPSSLAGIAGLACAACCVIPLMLGAGFVAGAGWAAVENWLPGVAVGLVLAAAAVWWWASRRHRSTCGGDGPCTCGTA
jgi:mercuric ion transport protein